MMTKETSHEATTPALPPPDEHMLELERLLEFAKVGTHELRSGETSPSNAAVAATNSEQAQDFTRRLNESFQTEEAAEERKEEMKEEEAIEVEEPASVASSSEGSGVLVEAPPMEAATEAASTVVPFQEPPHSKQQLSLFKPSFQFYTNERQIPKQLNAIQQHSVRNRANFQSKIHDVQVKLAVLTAKLANEEMDRSIEIRDAVRSCVHEPFRAVVDQMTLNNNNEVSLTSRWISAEKQYSELEAKIYKGVHVDLEQAKPSKIDLDGLAVEIREESLVTAKKEAAVARRWETECGSIARRFLEERSARIASLEIVGNKLNSVDHRRGQELLQTIRELRGKLEIETNERVANDESALDYIVKSTESVKRAILEAYDETEVDGDFEV